MLDNHLSKNNYAYLTGDKCTIADIAHWGWIAGAGWAGIDVEEFPTLKAWEERMLQRPGVEKGRHVPEPHKIKEMMKDEKAAAEAAGMHLSSALPSSCHANDLSSECKGVGADRKSVV